MLREPSGFLNAILARPDDDGPRLLCADYWDEIGETDRAEFIRTQIALAKLSRTDRRGGDLLAVEQRLLAQYRESWSEPLRGLATAPGFKRGFVEEVNIAARSFLAHGAEVFSRAPIRTLHFLDLGSHVERVFDSPLLKRLTGLTAFAQYKGEELASALAQSPHVGQLEKLALGRNELRCEGLQRLAESPRFQNLRELDLSANGIDRPGLWSFSERAVCPKLAVLELANNQLGASALERFAASQRFPRLQKLGLANNRVWTYQSEPLADEVRLLRIPNLDLRENGIGPSAIRVLLRCSLAAVRELDLGRNNLGDEGAALIANAPALAGLRVLKLNANGIGDEGLRALAESPRLGQLVALELNNNPVGDDGVRAVVESRQLQNLRQLACPGLGLSFRMRAALYDRYGAGG